MTSEKEINTGITYSSTYAATLSGARRAAGMCRLGDVDIEQTGVVYEEIRYYSGWMV